MGLIFDLRTTYVRPTYVQTVRDPIPMWAIGIKFSPRIPLDQAQKNRKLGKETALF